jgi:hypothetical protein
MIQCLKFSVTWKMKKKFGVPLSCARKFIFYDLKGAALLH